MHRSAYSNRCSFSTLTGFAIFKQTQTNHVLRFATSLVGGAWHCSKIPQGPTPHRPLLHLHPSKASALFCSSLAAFDILFGSPRTVTTMSVMPRAQKAKGVPPFSQVPVTINLFFQWSRARSSGPWQEKIVVGELQLPASVGHVPQGHHGRCTSAPRIERVPVDPRVLNASIYPVCADRSVPWAAVGQTISLPTVQETLCNLCRCISCCSFTFKW